MHGVNFPGDLHMMLLFKVNKITYRNNAILPLSATGRLTDETVRISLPTFKDNFPFARIALADQFETAILGRSSDCRRSFAQFCRAADLPILQASSPLISQCTWIAVQVDGHRLRAMKITPKEQAELVANIVFKSKAGVPFHRIILVSEDIDVHDDADIMWAFSTRCRPGLDEYPYEDVKGFALIPYMAHGNGNPTKGGKMVCDALFPVEYTTGRNWINTSFRRGYPKPLQDNILAKWEERGFSKLD